jgi:hypothetical protein
MLLDEVAHLKENTVFGKEKLRVRFSGAYQLVVSWRGRESDNRRSVLIAHVDQEGFLLRDFDSSGKYAVCWHTSAEAPDEQLVRESEVRLLTPDRVILGRVEKVRKPNAITPESPFNHEVLVRIEKSARVRNSFIVRNPLFKGYGNYNLTEWTLKEGVISAVHVDNAAGVSVLVALLNAMVRNNWRVNVDFLFTTCEEAGFCGIVSEILNARDDLLNGESKDDVICIVVDSSNSAGFCETPLHPALRSEGDLHEAEIALQCPVVRTGDAYGVFDPEVSQMLYSAGRSLESAADRYGRISWSGSSRHSPSDRTREFVKKDKSNKPDLTSTWTFAVGAMRGGWCEATPLSLQAKVRSQVGLEPLRLRCGSVAIPISDYRNGFRKELYPEKCHERALRGACELLGEAVHVCHRWPFGILGESVTRIEKEQTIVDGLMHWQTQFAVLSSVTNGWIDRTVAEKGSTM